MARVGWRGRQDVRPGRLAAIGDQTQPEFTPADRLGLERARNRADETAAVPLPFPVSRRRWAAFLSALPTLRRYLPWRALQHRELCAADAPGRTGMRSRSWRVRAYVWRCASLSQSREPGARAARAHPAPAAPAQALSRHAVIARRAVRSDG